MNIKQGVFLYLCFNLLCALVLETTDIVEVFFGTIILIVGISIVMGMALGFFEIYDWLEG